MTPRPNSCEVEMLLIFREAQMKKKILTGFLTYNVEEPLRHRGLANLPTRKVAHLLEMNELANLTWRRRRFVDPNNAALLVNITWVS